ncbi:MAG: hypothetical protein Alpg2KO_15210 [Alphaproteobacteria bacterium]
MTEAEDVLQRIQPWSPYLTDLLQGRDGQTAEDLVSNGLGGLSGQYESHPSRTAMLARLRKARQAVSLGAALGDLQAGWPVIKVTDALTRLADSAVVAALDWVLAEKARIFDGEVSAETSGIVILAMGKMGAGELNFSSDIDLIVFYDPDLVRLRRPDRMGIETERLTRMTMALLDERTPDGFVARTDLRLRPDPASTPAAVPLAQAEAYYTSLARTWERAAMIKARPIAGDMRVWSAMQPFMQPFIWRRSLDYLALEDIMSLKSRMREEKGFDALSLPGQNVKLGRGGIRDIEFHVQSLQLIHGGRDETLRVAPTLEALKALSDAGHMSDQDAQALADHYQLLRRVEHGIQMAEDRQTHLLPDDMAGISALGAFLDLPDLAEQLATAMAEVDRITAIPDQQERMAGQGIRLDGPEISPSELAELERLGFEQPEHAARLVQGWMYGRIAATRSQRSRQVLARILQRLLEKLAQFGAADQALGRFDAFLSRQTAGADLFALLDHNPPLIDLLAEIVGQGGDLAEHLARSPRLLDMLIGASGDRLTADRQHLSQTLDRSLSRARDYQDVLEGARRWLLEQKFSVGLDILRDKGTPVQLGRHLAAVADVVIGHVVKAAQAEFEQQHGSIAGAELVVMAFGKFGGQAPALSSDLDLVILYDVPDGAMSDGTKPLDATTYHARLIRRILTAITAQMGEGRLYEADARLRPSGNAGPLAVSFQAFEKYQRQDAWVWEHMALTRARVMAGDTHLTQRVEALIQDILTAPRNGRELQEDVTSMRMRIADHHGRDPDDPKMAPGGLTDIEFAAQYLQLASGRADCLHQDTATALQQLSAAGLLPEKDCQTLTSTLAQLDLVRHRSCVTPKPLDDDADRHSYNRERAAAIPVVARILNITPEQIGQAHDP